MPTRGRFVCHVHCLVHDGAVRSSPCRPHHENFGRNLYHMFVPAYSASQSFFLFFTCGIRVASMSNVFPYLLLKWCSHISISMGVLILFRSSRWSCQSFFNRRVSLQVDPIISTFARSNLSSSQRCSLHSSQASFVLPPSHPFLQGLGFLNQVSILLMGSLSILFFQCSYLVILMKILRERQVHLSSFFFFSNGYNSNFVDHIPFPRFKYLLLPVHLIIIPLLAINLFRSAEDISKTRVSTLLSFKLFQGCYLIQAI